MLKRFIVCSAFLIIAAGVSATPLTPTSYVHNNGASGSYPDDTGSQLTDGLLNNIIPSVNLGTPDSFNWVGWDLGRNPSVTFNFGQIVTVNQVSIDTVRWEPAGVYLPTQVKIGSSLFSVGSGYTNMDKALLTFNGSWTGSSLTLDMTAGGYWTFVDEVSFDGHVGAPTQQPTAQAPDGTSTALMLLIGFVGVSAVMARRQHLSVAHR